MRRYLTLVATYRGREGSWAWMLHRVSGVGVWAFVVLHVVDIYLVGGNPAAYDELLAFYASPLGRVLEVLLGAALLYHALNGLRIVILDLWPRMTAYHRELWWLTWAAILVVGVPGALIILRPLARDVADVLLRLVPLLVLIVVAVAVIVWLRSRRRGDLA